MEELIANFRNLRAFVSKTFWGRNSVIEWMIELKYLIVHTL